MLPNTLRSWRQWTDDRPREPVRTLWEPLAPFFAAHDLVLFQPIPRKPSSLPDLPDPHTIRAPDEFHYWNPAFGPQPSKNSLYYPARTTDGKDVIIRLVAIGDEGQQHLAILRDVAAPPEVARQSHVVPLLRELEKDGMVFAVFPLVFDSGYEETSRAPWYRQVKEVLDVVEQLLEGFAFLHRRLIAHRDFSFGKVLLNYGACYCVWFDARETFEKAQAERQPGAPAIPLPEFRSTFPAFWFINDLEHSVQLSPDSSPEERVVVGPPGDVSLDHYNKPLGPEALTAAPYCPFKTDVFQLVWTFSHLFDKIDSLGPEFKILIGSMLTLDPSQRPTASEALVRLREIRSRATAEALDESVPAPSYAASKPLDRLRKELPLS